MSTSWGFRTPKSLDIAAKHALSERIRRHEEALIEFVLVQGLIENNNLAERSMTPDEAVPDARRWPPEPSTSSGTHHRTQQFLLLVLLPLAKQMG